MNKVSLFFGAAPIILSVLILTTDGIAFLIASTIGDILGFNAPGIRFPLHMNHAAKKTKIDSMNVIIDIRGSSTCLDNMGFMLNIPFVSGVKINLVV